MMVLSIDCDSWHCAERLYSIYEKKGLFLSKYVRLSKYSVALEDFINFFIIDNILTEI